MYVSLQDSPYSVARINLFVACAVSFELNEDSFEDEQTRTYQYFALVTPFVLLEALDVYTTLPYVRKQPFSTVILLKQIVETVLVLPLQVDQTTITKNKLKDRLDDLLVLLDNQWLFDHPRDPSTWTNVLPPEELIEDFSSTEECPFTLGDISPRKKFKDGYKNKHWEPVPKKKKLLLTAVKASNIFFCC